MVSDDVAKPEQHPFYPMNIGPLTHTVAGKKVPKWIELANHTVLVPVDILRQPNADLGERCFDEYPSVVFGVCADPRSLLGDDAEQAGPDADAWRAEKTALDV